MNEEHKTTMKYVRDHLNDTNSTMTSEFRGLKILSLIPIGAGEIPDDTEVLLIPHKGWE